MLLIYAKKFYLHHTEITPQVATESQEGLLLLTMSE